RREVEFEIGIVRHFPREELEACRLPKLAASLDAARGRHGQPTACEHPIFEHRRAIATWREGGADSLDRPGRRIRMTNQIDVHRLPLRHSRASGNPASLPRASKKEAGSPLARG